MSRSSRSVTEVSRMARTSGTSKNDVLNGSRATTRPIWPRLTTGASQRRALRVSTWQNRPMKYDVWGKNVVLRNVSGWRELLLRPESSRPM